MGSQFRYLFLPVLLYKKNYLQVGQSTAGSQTRLKCFRFYYHSNFAMHDEYVEIKGIPTRILTFGKWINEPFKQDDEIILCITGKLFNYIFYQRLTGTFISYYLWIFFRKSWNCWFLYYLCNNII